MRTRFPIRRNSLFVKLLTGFLLVILLLSSFNALSFAFFKETIQKEIISYNTLSLDKTVSAYEKQFDLMRRHLLRLYFHDSLGSLTGSGNRLNYAAAWELKTEINAMINNDLLHLDNLLVLPRGHNAVVDKNGVVTMADMFGNYYLSADYGTAFWNRQFAESYHFRAFPAALFREAKFDGTVTDIGVLMPVVVKNQFNSQTVMAAFLDVGSMYAALHAGKDGFVILNGDGETLFASQDVRLPEAVAEQVRLSGLGRTLIDNSYYFYQTGSISGLTYLYVIPYTQIAEQVQRLTVVLIGILAVAIVLASTLSVVVSYRLNHPLQRIVRLAERHDANAAFGSNVHEFNVIGRSLAAMIDDNRAIRDDLTRKTVLLRNYGYISKIKSIYQEADLADLIETDKPFYLALFQIAYLPESTRLTGGAQDKASYYMKEFIALTLSRRFSESFTLQMEKDQILSLVFAGEDCAAALLETLRELKRVFDRDKEHVLLTIACSPKLRDSADLREAYEEARQMLLQRKLTGETQLITEPQKEERIYEFSPMQEQEFFHALEAGRAQQAVELLNRLLTGMEREAASARQFFRFANEFVNKLMKALLAQNVDISALFSAESPYQKIGECTNRGQLETLLAKLTEGAAALIRDHQTRPDPIKEFVIEYINQHYVRDLSLEEIADKLNMSRSYLSTYFHEKTGLTFTEYVNDLRIRRAKEMLTETNARIGEVAHRVGYQNVNSFIRMFKRLTGQTPGEFRKMAYKEKPV